MKATYPIFARSFAASAAASAQVVPAATGPREGPVAENLHYDVRYSQRAEFTTDQGNWQTGIASADLDYSNGRFAARSSRPLRRLHRFNQRPRV